MISHSLLVKPVQPLPSDYIWNLVYETHMCFVWKGPKAYYNLPRAACSYIELIFLNRGDEMINDVKMAQKSEIIFLMEIRW